MTLYPNLVAVVEDLTPDGLAALVDRSGVSLSSIESIVAGRCAASLSVQMRLGHALGANPLDLFRLDDDLEDALPPARYVSDPATLRAIDGRRS